MTDRLLAIILGFMNSAALAACPAGPVELFSPLAKPAAASRQAAPAVYTRFILRKGDTAVAVDPAQFQYVLQQIAHNEPVDEQTLHHLITERDAAGHMVAKDGRQLSPQPSHGAVRLLGVAHPAQRLSVTCQPGSLGFQKSVDQEPFAVLIGNSNQTEWLCPACMARKMPNRWQRSVVDTQVFDYLYLSGRL